MIKYKYLINGNQLYVINSIYSNIIQTQATNYRLTKDDTRHTYDSSQLESLGFIIKYGVVRGCMS